MVINRIELVNFKKIKSLKMQEILADSSIKNNIKINKFRANNSKFGQRISLKNEIILLKIDFKILQICFYKANFG